MVTAVVVFLILSLIASVLVLAAVVAAGLQGETTEDDIRGLSSPFPASDDLEDRSKEESEKAEPIPREL